MMKPMPLCPGPRPPYLENEVHCLKTRTGALEERASAADARMDAAEAATASATRLASEAMGAAAASAAGASVQRLVSPFLATLSLRSVDLPSAKRWLDSRDWAPSDAPACSVHVRSTSSVRRWFDWRRDLASEFAVHVSGRYDSVHPFAVAGMSSMGMLCPAGSNPPPELVAFVPHMMVDGVNEAGVFAEVNVVPLKPDGSTGWSGTACPSAAAVYECLARFGSAAEAAAWIAASVYVPPKFAAATGYSVHFMLADASGAVWTVEDGAAREVSGSGDDAPCMSNFRLYGTDGSRSAGTAAAVAPYDPLGSGVERYALLKSGSYSVQDLFFTGAYASPSPRPSEFAGLARADGTPVTLANLSEQATLDAVASAIALYDPSDTSGKWWHTAHFAEYDLESRTFSVRVRETAASYSFGLFEKAAEGVQGGGGSQVQADWNEADSSDPAFIRNKPTELAPTAHKDSHKAGGSDAIAPSDIGALPSNAEDIDGYVMSFGGAQYALQTPYTQSGMDGWGTSDGAWKLFVAADGTVLLLKDGAPKPTNPLSVAGLPLPWNLQLLDGSGTAVVADAGSVSTGEIIGHLRSRSNPHGVTAAQVGLGNVDNTSDANKPISTAVQNALNQKANTSTTYTKTEVDSKLGGKVDKAAGKGIVLLGSAADGVAANSEQLMTPTHVAYIDGATERIVIQSLGGPVIGSVAMAKDLPYAKSSAVGQRKVWVIDPPPTPGEEFFLPEIPEGDEIINCDIVVPNEESGSQDVGLTLTPARGQQSYKVRHPNGETITCKAGCVTMVSCVGINGLGWCVAACNTFSVPEQNVGLPE